MATIGFVGLGNMGLPMALNLVKAGHDVVGHDLSDKQLATLSKAGGRRANGLDDIATCEVIVSMLPAGKHVAQIYGGEEG